MNNESDGAYKQLKTDLIDKCNMGTIIGAQVLGEGSKGSVRVPKGVIIVTPSATRTLVERAGVVADHTPKNVEMINSCTLLRLDQDSHITPNWGPILALTESNSSNLPLP